jgi:hypothetical protein
LWCSGLTPGQEESYFCLFYSILPVKSQLLDIVLAADGNCASRRTLTNFFLFCPSVANLWESFPVRMLNLIPKQHRDWALMFVVPRVPAGLERAVVPTWRFSARRCGRAATTCGLLQVRCCWLVYAATSLAVIFNFSNFCVSFSAS